MQVVGAPLKPPERQGSVRGRSQWAIPRIMPSGDLYEGQSGPKRTHSERILPTLALALLGRLAVLKALGLAQRGHGSWELAPEMESTLRALGERGDIIKAMNRALNGQVRGVSFSERGDLCAYRRAGDRQGARG